VMSRTTSDGSAAAIEYGISTLDMLARPMLFEPFAPPPRPMVQSASRDGREA
jgi:hypothetical protein